MSTTSLPPGTTTQRAYLNLFGISFLILFFELSCIRWFGSTVVFLTFFTNLVLMACFLGMSVGCLAASHRRNFIDWVLPLTLLALVLAFGILKVYERYGQLLIDVGGQQSPQQIYFGTEYRGKDPSSFVVPIEVVAGTFFVLIALIFVGLGQVMGRSFNAIEDRVRAYSTNVLGSLCGIVAFGVASQLRTTPLVWFTVCATMVMLFTRPWRSWMGLAQAGVIYVAALSAFGLGPAYSLLWSPYYKILYYAHSGLIQTNNIGHQEMVSVAERGPAYVLPHLLNRDAGRDPFKDVLIIGAGSGNDVQAALSHGAERIDAVEIDPVLNRIGRLYHPDRPYDDPRVSIQLDDGRSFARRTSHTYDLALYALVDSLVLHSGYSSLRLESYLFTEQAFRDVKARLKPGGTFVMCNYYRQGWVVGRLVRMAKEVFGTEPLVISLPYQESVTATTEKPGFTFILVGNGEGSSVDSIRQALERSGAFWVNKVPRRNESINGYMAAPPEDQPEGEGRAEATTAATEIEDDRPWLRIGATTVDTTGSGRLPSDDWPFLYLRSPTIPSLTLRWMAMVAVLSLVILFAFLPSRRIRPDGRMFFLGAGFMLLETKGVVHMALLFGSTWVVNSVVFFAILVMILLSNLFVLATRPRLLWPYYLLLAVSLLINAFVPMEYFLALPGMWKAVVSCAVVFLPVFFAGVIFAAAFRDSRQPDVDFASNIGGVILGGLSEQLSLILGFNHLLFVALAFYALSAIGRRRTPA